MTISYRVLKTDHRSREFGDECRIQSPREIMIEGSLYGIYAEFIADEDPKILLGVEPHAGGRFTITGKHVVALLPGEFKGRASTRAQLSSLSGGVIDFEVVDKDSGASNAYQIQFDVLPCTCRRYDGP
jgi:hypothetical protein